MVLEPSGKMSAAAMSSCQRLLRLNQRRDEGDVTVHFSVERTGNTGQPITIDKSGIVYGVAPNGNLMWMRHDGRGDGSFAWAPMPNGGKRVGVGWNFKHVCSGGGGIIYGVTTSGDLMWMRHEGRHDGSFSWTPVPNGGKKVGVGGGKRVGAGWSALAFKPVFPG